MWAALIPAIASLAGSLFGNKKTAGQKSMEQTSQLQQQYLQQQMARNKALDPVHDALLRMAMGMMPTYAQGSFNAYQGLPGVTPPSGGMIPGLGGGGYQMPTPTQRPALPRQPGPYY